MKRFSIVCPWALAATDMKRCPSHPARCSPGDRGRQGWSAQPQHLRLWTAQGTPCS